MLSTIYALGDNNKIVTFDSGSPSTIRIPFNKTGQVTGLATGDTLVSIAFRPKTGRLYALGAEARLYTINTTTGAASEVGRAPFLTGGLAGPQSGFAFDPTTDKVRIVNDSADPGHDVNLRVDPDKGTLVAADPPLAYAPGDLNATEPHPPIEAAAYSPGTPTTLYEIDGDTTSLVTQGSPSGTPVSPDTGRLFTVRRLIGNGEFTVYAALGIATDRAAYAVLTVFNGPGSLIADLYRVDLSAGSKTLVDPVGPSGTTPVHSIAIAPNVEAPPRLSINDVARFENSLRAVNAVFTVSLSKPSTQPVTVRYATIDNTAHNKVDYRSVSGTLTFLPGQTTRTFPVPILNGTVAKPDLTYFVRLKDPVGATIADDTGVGTIHNNNSHPPPVVQQFDRRLVTALNGALFGTATGPEGLTDAARRLDLGHSPLELARQLVASRPFETKLVQGIHQDVGLPAGAEQLKAEVDALQKGGTTEQLRVQLLGSRPYYLARGGGTDRGFLTALARDLLGHLLDGRTLAADLAQLKNGTSRATLARRLMRTVEAGSHRARALAARFRGIDFNLASRSPAMQQLIRLDEEGEVFSRAVLLTVEHPKFIRFLNRLIPDLLNRPADLHGIDALQGADATYLNQLDQGFLQGTDEVALRGQVVARIMALPAYRVAVVDNLYGRLLGRSSIGDPNATPYTLVPELLDTTNAVVASLMTVSNEYRMNRSGITDFETFLRQVAIDTRGQNHPLTRGEFNRAMAEYDNGEREADHTRNLEVILDIFLGTPQAARHSVDLMYQKYLPHHAVTMQDEDALILPSADAQTNYLDPAMDGTHNDDGDVDTDIYGSFLRESQAVQTIVSTAEYFAQA